MTLELGKVKGELSVATVDKQQLGQLQGELTVSRCLAGEVLQTRSNLAAPCVAGIASAGQGAGEAGRLSEGLRRASAGGGATEPSAAAHAAANVVLPTTALDAAADATNGTPTSAVSPTCAAVPACANRSSASGADPAVAAGHAEPADASDAADVQSDAADAADAAGTSSTVRIAARTLASLEILEILVEIPGTFACYVVVRDRIVVCLMYRRPSWKLVYGISHKALPFTALVS